MCEERKRGEGEAGEENETVNPRGEVEAGPGQVQKKGPLRRAFSVASCIIRITAAGGTGTGTSSSCLGCRPCHQSFCQQKRQLERPLQALVAEGEPV